MRKVTVEVHDGLGLNCTIVSANALEIVKSLLDSVKRNYVVIDLTHCARPKSERDNKEDYIIMVE